MTVLHRTDPRPMPPRLDAARTAGKENDDREDLGVVAARKLAEVPEPWLSNKANLLKIGVHIYKDVTSPFFRFVRTKINLANFADCPPHWERASRPLCSWRIAQLRRRVIIGPDQDISCERPDG